MATHDRE
jgi:hypothetical protein